MFSSCRRCFSTADIVKTHNLCRSCKSEVDREYYQRNKEKVKARVKKYRDENPEKVKDTKRRQYLNGGKEDVLRNNRKRRAREASVENAPYTTKQVLDKYGDTCYLCGEDINLNAPRKTGVEGWERGLHLDHLVGIVNGGADKIENIRPTHGLCNTSKTKKEKQYV
jgi:hypothetical protein